MQAYAALKIKMRQEYLQIKNTKMLNARMITTATRTPTMRPTGSGSGPAIGPACSAKHGFTCHL